MATALPQTSLDGALFELVARGEKDKFFFRDSAKSVQPFDYRYKEYPPTLPEVRHTIASTNVKWGQAAEFELETPGDLLQSVHLVVELPSWLPPEQVKTNGKTIVRDLSGNAWGYTNGIGYFLFKKIQIFQDQFLLQEVSGDALYALTRTQSSYNQLFVDDATTGIHSGDELGIQRNATPPGRLRLRIPFPGCAEGDSGFFPLCAVRSQTFRIKIMLRSLEELIETSDQSILTPSPFGKEFIQTFQDGSQSNFKALERIQMQQPSIVLETRQLYTTNEYRNKIVRTNQDIAFKRIYENYFTFGGADYSPLDRGGNALTKRQLDGQFLTERQVSFFRTTGSIRKNKLIQFENDNGGSGSGQFFNSMTLVIASQEREGPWAPFVWKDVMQHAKETRATSKEIPIMNWGYGWNQQEAWPYKREPTGGINFTTADKPTLNISLNPIVPDPVSGERTSELRNILESWCVYEIFEGRGRYKYAN